MVGSNKIDVVENGAIVRVFLLEGAFPQDAPSDVLSKAGAFWESYALTHAALGFLVEESESKHVLEYYATNYIGSFLPTLPPLPPTPAPSTPAPVAPSPAPVASSSPTSSGTAAPSAPAPAATPAPAAVTAAPASSGTTAPTTATGTPSPTAPAGNGTVNYYHGDGGGGGGGGPGLYRSAAHDDEARLKGVAGGGNFGAERGGGDGGGWGSGWGGNAGNGTTDVTWDNKAAVRVSAGFDDKTWTSANYVAKITGLLYNDLTGWSNAYREENPIYQPLSACGGDGDGVSKDDGLSHTGASDSYDFVWAAFKRLANNGVIFEQEVVLKPKRTVMCLFPEGGVDATEVVDAADNEEVGEYFRDTSECVRALAIAAAAGKSPRRGPACTPGSKGDDGGDGWAGEGGVSVMLGVGNCLQGHENAFLYHNSTSYLRLPLNNTASPPALSWPPPRTGAALGGGGGGGGMTARLVRYAPELPPRPIQPPGGPDRAYIVYVAIGLAALGVTVAALRALYLRKQDRVAYGRSGRGGINSGHGGGGGGHGGARALFSSSAGHGWKSGGRSGSDFGEFDFSVGDEYEGALFPTDNYSSGGLSSSRSQSGGGGGWRGLGKSPPSEVGPMEVPLLKHTDPQARMREGGRGGGRSAATTSSSRRSRGRGSTGAEEASYRGGGSEGYGGGGGGGNGGGSSPPPFSRVLGTMGAAPAAGRRRSSGGGGSGGGGSGGRAREADGFSGRRTKRTSAGGAAARPGEGGAADDDSDDMADQQGPFGSGGGAGGGGGASLERDDQPEGDEVFC